MRALHCLLLLGATACASAASQSTTAPSPARDSAHVDAERGALSVPNADPFPSTYKPFPSRTTVIRNVNLLTAAGPMIRNGAILLQDGKIAAVGATVNAPADALVIDGGGKYVTPGIIDDHSHLGVYAAPGVNALSDGNEATNPVTPQVWAEHSVWPQDPQFPRNLAGGVTTLQVLPGSANLIGGRSVVLKVVPGRTVQEMKFPGAKYGLKMACGENPKRVYGNRGGPQTRMGNVAGYRAAWIRAQDYRRKWDKWNADHKGDPPTRDLGLETLAEVLRGNILVHNHCYRADEMAQMIDIAHEFGYKVRSFHHAVEAYKIADLLAKEGIAASVWADDWKAVEGGTFAMVLPDVQGKLAKKLPTEKREGDLAESMVGASLAFIVDAIVSVLVTLRTQPKPISELQGLVYGMANTDESVAKSHAPALLGGFVLLGALILTIVFW